MVALQELKVRDAVKDGTTVFFLMQKKICKKRCFEKKRYANTTGWK